MASHIPGVPAQRDDPWRSARPHGRNVEVARPRIQPNSASGHRPRGRHWIAAPGRSLAPIWLAARYFGRILSLPSMVSGLAMYDWHGRAMQAASKVSHESSEKQRSDGRPPESFPDQAEQPRFRRTLRSSRGEPSPCTSGGEVPPSRGPIRSSTGSRCPLASRSAAGSKGCPATRRAPRTARP